MPFSSPSVLASAADTRRRELPASVALVILTGGLAAAIMGGSGAVVWAATMALLLIVDAEIYRRLDLAETELRGHVVTALSGWAFLTSAFYATLPAALWLNGEAAGAAAAMVLWVAGVVRHFNGGAGKLAIALAGAAPPALSLLVSPLAMAAASLRTDWDLAVIAAVGGGALMVYVAQARMSASEAEEGLRRATSSENLQHTLAQLLFDQAAIAAFLIDRDHRVVTMSRRAVSGANHEDLSARRFDTLCPWTASRWNDAFARALKGEHVVCAQDEVITAEGVCWYEWEARPWRGADGAVCGVLAHGRDITALMEARGEAAANEGRLRVAMQQAEEALKHRRALNLEAGVGAGAQTATFEDGSAAEMFAHLHDLLLEMDAGDEVLAETLASLRAAREAAEAASISKSQFLTSMSHELRTPLNAIIGYSEILQEEAEADGRDTDLKDLDRVLTAARQLLHLINDILDLSKIEAGRMDVSTSDFDVETLIKESLATTRPAMEKNGNTLRMEIENGLGAARSDPFKLNQCLLNLLSNAAKFTKQGDVIIRARRETRDGADWIEIAVSDSGIGMSAEQVERLFNAFVQADAATSRKYGGTGLGLAITRRMMQLLGGDVSVTSAAGKGSTFVLRLPALLREGAFPAKIEFAPGASDGGGRVALVIDDEESARDLAARSLSRLGFAVHQAANGQAGLNLARTLAPSVIVLDINLPDVSGWDVLGVLHTAAETASIPIIVHSVDDNRQRALSLGACEHLVKPADRDVLAAAALRFARVGSEISPSADVPAQSLAKTA